MKQANARLRLNRFTDIPLKGLTPAELVVLHVIHSANVGEDPVIGITDITEATEVKEIIPAEPEVPAIPASGIKGTAGYQPAVPAVPAVPQKVVTRPRETAEELRRLRSKYGALVNKKGDSIIKLIWPGLDSKLPETFEQVKTKELQYNGLEVGTTDFGTSGGAAVQQ